ncbi:hypothetical protein [Nonomuraea endophytica]|uniref:Uncharacterized protein n=1 Tax=Nonomuraea endophytica TaxID=714136 RepID=A0A7W7ZZK5_9ACTN|nr:hypothetical protein [Nonomuraea endophytica]MBB5076742.1 hypothetical protein [Nonomuraea endophytica]
MRQSPQTISWDWIALTIGGLIGLAYFTMPVSIAILGTELSCGPSLVASFGLVAGGESPLESGIVGQCAVQGAGRSLIGALAAVGGSILFLVLNGRISTPPAVLMELRSIHTPCLRADGSEHECGACHVSWPCPTSQVLGATSR